MRNLLFYFLLSGLTLALIGCKTKSKPLAQTELKVMGDIEKFDFDINALDKDGLMGPSDGKVSVDYQFCFPKGEEYEKQILAIDPELKISTKSRACSGEQNVAFGSTHKPGHQEILRSLSELDFVKKISRVWYE